MEYYNEYNDGMLMSFAGLIWIGIICIYGLCVYGTYKYAKRLGRSGSWGVLAVLMSPFLASFVLCLMGRRTRTARHCICSRLPDVERNVCEKCRVFCNGLIISGI